MPECPSTREILSDLVALRAWTPQGCNAISQYVKDHVDRWGLGDAHIFDIPEGAPGSEIKPTPTIVAIDVGKGPKTADETIISHGHKDVVPPDDYPEGFERRPDSLIPDALNPDIHYGAGSNDMLAWVASILTVLRLLQGEIKLARHRHWRILIVPLEEQQSQGTHALFTQQLKFLIEDIGPDNAAACSGEIPVGGLLTDAPALYIGRTGRVGFEIRILGESMHTGRVQREIFDEQASVRFGKLVQDLKRFTLAPHPSDPLRIMPESLCIPGKLRSIDPDSMSVSAQIVFRANVLYGNPSLDQSDIHHHLRKFIEESIGKNNFMLDFEPGRRLPFTKPWLEQPNHPYVQHGLRYAEEVYRGHVQLRAGRGVADEAILVHKLNIPCITLPPRGQGDHTRFECVNVVSIDECMVPWQLKMLAHEGSLIR